MSDYQNHANRIYAALLDIESSCAPDHLFVCSYLLGHVSLVGAEQGVSAKQFEQDLQHSLDAAFKIDHLSAEDRQAISSLWYELQAKEADATLT